PSGYATREALSNAAGALDSVRRWSPDPAPRRPQVSRASSRPVPRLALFAAGALESALVFPTPLVPKLRLGTPRPKLPFSCSRQASGCHWRFYPPVRTTLGYESDESE